MSVDLKGVVDLMGVSSWHCLSASTVLIYAWNRTSAAREVELANT